MLDGVQFCGRALAERDDTLHRIAVLALEVEDQLQALLHLGQLARVEFDAFAVVAQGARQVIQRADRGSHLLLGVGQGGVELRQQRERVLGLAQQIERGAGLVVARMERAVSFIGVLC